MKMLGHSLQLVITSASSPDAGAWLSPYTIEESELGDVHNGLLRNCTEGDFTASCGNLYTIEDREPVCYAGSWSLIPNYALWTRIYIWWYNYTPEEALTEETFKEAFGKFLGRHYYEKWTSYACSIEKMICYFGRDTQRGQCFLDMIMRRVMFYEGRHASENA